MPINNNHRSFPAQVLTSGLAAIYVFTNVAASHASETAFWGERRRVARARFQSTPGEGRPLYAQLPKNISSSPDLSAVLGHVSPPTAVNLPALGKAVSNTTDRRILDVAQAVLPYGNIRFVRESKKPGAPLILHIQDVHGNLEAQKNMAEMMLALARDHGVRLAGLEGATGPFATDEFKPYPDQEAVKKVAGYFMKKDILGGPEYAALASEKPITLWGIEDPALYQANVKAVKDSLAGRTEAEMFLASLNGALDSLKKVHYTEDLQAFDKNQSLYDQGHKSLSDFVQTLTKFDGKNDAVLSIKFPNVSRLLSALREEKKLNFSVVEQDRSALVEKLVAKLSQDDLQDLVRRSVDLRGGKTTHNAYHAYLRALCAKNGLSLSAYPSLTAYMHYVAASEDIDREDLLKEMASLETSAQDALIKTADQRKLVDLSRDASRLKNLLNNEMTPDDWAAYKARQSEIPNLPARLKTLDPNATVRWPEDLAHFLSPFESFCARATDRNAALAGRLLEKMKQEKQTIAILVAGGFHTEGLLDSLAMEGASVAVLTPKIGPVDPNHRYLDAFAQDPLPLEKIFNGEPISMKTECPMERDSIAGVAVRNQLHLGILLVIFENIRKRRMSMGNSFPEIKRELVKTLKEYKSRVQSLVRINPFLKAVTAEGVVVEVDEYEVTFNYGSVSASPVQPTFMERVLKSPTLREEWQIVWQEKFGFLSPWHYFFAHPQWKGIQKVIGGALILSLWLILGETATTVAQFLSNVGTHPDLASVTGILAGWSATLPSHVAWNRLSEKINAVLAQNNIQFRLPRLTMGSPTGSKNMVTQVEGLLTAQEKGILSRLDEIYQQYTGQPQLHFWTPVLLKNRRDVLTLKFLFKFVETYLQDPALHPVAIRAIEKEIAKNLKSLTPRAIEFLVDTLALLSARSEDVYFLTRMRDRTAGTAKSDAISAAIEYIQDTIDLHREMGSPHLPSLFPVGMNQGTPVRPEVSGLQYLLDGTDYVKKVVSAGIDDDGPFTETRYESDKKEVKGLLLREAVVLKILKQLGADIPILELKWDEGQFVLRRYYNWVAYQDFNELRAYRGLLGFIAVATLSKLSFFGYKKDDPVNPRSSLVSFELSQSFQIPAGEPIDSAFFNELCPKKIVFPMPYDVAGVEIPFFIHRDPGEREQLRRIRRLAYALFDISDTVIRGIIDQVYGELSFSGDRSREEVGLEKDELFKMWKELMSAIQRYYVIHPRGRREGSPVPGNKIIFLERKSSRSDIPGALGLWDIFTFSRGWSLSQRGWAEGGWTGVLYLLWMAGAMAFGFIPMAPTGLDPVALLAFSLASFVNPSLAFGVAIAVLSITLHRISGVKLRISEEPEKEWPTVLIASFKSLSGLAGIPMIAVGVSLASLGGAFGLSWMILGVAGGALIVYYGVELGAGAHQKVNARAAGNLSDSSNGAANSSRKKQLKKIIFMILLSFGFALPSTAPAKPPISNPTVAQEEKFEAAAKAWNAQLEKVERQDAKVAAYLFHKFIVFLKGKSDKEKTSLEKKMELVLFSQRFRDGGTTIVTWSPKGDPKTGARGGRTLVYYPAQKFERGPGQEILVDPKTVEQIETVPQLHPNVKLVHQNQVTFKIEDLTYSLTKTEDDKFVLAVIGQKSKGDPWPSSSNTGKSDRINSHRKRGGNEPISNDFARNALRRGVAHYLNEVFMGGKSGPMTFDSGFEKSVAPLINQIETGSMDEAIKQLSVIDRAKEALVLLAGQLRWDDSAFVLSVYERAGESWAGQFEGALHVGAHDFNTWGQDARLLAFLKGAIYSAIASNRPVMIAAKESDRASILRQLGVSVEVVEFTSNGIRDLVDKEGSVLDARAFMAGRTGALFVADLKTVIHHDGIDVTSYTVLSRAILKELKSLARVLQNA